MSEFKYDQTDMHLRYEKSRTLPEDTMKVWLETLASFIPLSSVKTIIDLGCGTGRFTKGLSNQFSAKVYGIDSSWKMLSNANQSVISPLIKYIQGSAENIPLMDGTVDLIFLSMVYHHIKNKSVAINEFARVLSKNGFLSIRTSTIDSLDSYPYLDFFPDARQINMEKIPSRKNITEFLQSNGFALNGHSIIHQITADSLQKYFEKISLRGLSDLSAISDDKFQDGLTRFKKYCYEHETGEPVYEDIDLFVFRVI
jgi:ubiquinone/menaquinone biosynthesis C-methylase UbiE